MTPSFVCCATVTVVSAAVSLGFSLASTRGAAHAERSLAPYASARSFALLAASVAAFWAASLPWLELTAGCVIIVPTGDAAIGVTIRNHMKTVKPAMTAIFNIAALPWLLA